MSTLSLTSPVFKNNGFIPEKYTCDGDDMSPPLRISGVPENAKSLVLIVDDPDAPDPPVGGWDHWIIFNLEPTTNNLQEGREPIGVSGKNSWNKLGYGGPCPPSGAHRYFFKLYALDVVLELQSGADKKMIEQAMAGHILDRAELIGLYKRK